MQRVSISSAENDRHTAFHEAAHCVVGYVHGWTLTPELGVRIGDEPICCMRMPERDQYTVRHVQQALAGWLAEVILARPNRDLARSDDDLVYFLEQVRWDQNDEADADDYQVFHTLLTWFPEASDADLLSVYRDHEAQTLALLSEPDVWSSVEQLAEALITERHIGDPEMVVRIIMPALLSEAERRSNRQRFIEDLAALQPVAISDAHRARRMPSGATHLALASAVTRPRGR